MLFVFTNFQMDRFPIRGRRRFVVPVQVKAVPVVPDIDEDGGVFTQVSDASDRRRYEERCFREERG